MHSSLWVHLLGDCNVFLVVIKESLQVKLASTLVFNNTCTHYQCFSAFILLALMMLRHAVAS